MGTATYHIEVATWPDDRTNIKSIRRKVFVIEQGVDSKIEWDGKDSQCLHVLAYHNDEIIGTGRMQANGHIGRLAVLSNWRGRGVGKGMVSALIQAAQRDHNFVYLNAQVQAIGFYESFGFVADGAVFMEAGIPHQRMELHFREAISNEDLSLEIKDHHGIEDNYQALIELCSSARRSIDIFTPDLDRRMLSRGRFINVLKEFIKISPKSRVRALVHQPAIPIRYDHRLIELSQDYSSYIQLRETNPEYNHYPYSYVLVDAKAYLYRPHAAEYSATLEFTDNVRARHLHNEFDEIWNLSDSISGIKRLFI